MSNVLFPNLHKFVSTNKSDFSTKPFPKNSVKWCHSVRPIVEGKKRSFVACPFWEEIYNDTCKRNIIVGGRQIFKSTYCSDRLAYMATTKSNSVAVYVTYDDLNLLGFSKVKFRNGCLKNNPKLQNFVLGPSVGSKNQVFFKNGSVVYLVTDEDGYVHIEGKSPDEIIVDEAQYHELENVQKLNETMTMSHGNLKITGIGGEGGSEYERIWLESDQREWVYDDPNWRDKLQFDEKGLVIGNYLKEVLQGRWIAQAPENKSFHGYHLPQTIIPHIPLSIEDAIYNYKIAQNFSIEWKRKIYSSSIFQSHVLGQFYKATRRPITREMVLACMEPYFEYSLLSANEVLELKETFGNKIVVLMGIDWGSGKVGNSSTVISIIIKWKGKSEESSRFQLAFIDKRGQEDSLLQTEYVVNLFEEYGCDFGVADLGYGEIQTNAIINGGANPQTGKKYEGLGVYRFKGCRTISSLVSVLQDKEGKIDEELEEIDRIQVDKTHIIQNFIDFISGSISHPLYPNNEKTSRKKFLIPYSEPWRVDWLIKDFTSITRRDLEKNQLALVEDTRQHPKKEFNNPLDSVMSIIYCLIADQFFNPVGSFRGTWGISRKKIRRTYSRNNGVNSLFRGTRSL